MVGRIVGHGPKTKYLIDGVEVTKKEFDRTFPDKPIGDGSALIGWKELHSDACCVHPKQIKEAIDSARAKGVPTDFDADGRPIFRCRSHRAKYLRAYGFFDRSAGYSDPAPNLPKPPEPEWADV